MKIFDQKNQNKQIHSGPGDNVAGDKIVKVISDSSFIDCIDQFENLLILLSRKKFKEVINKTNHFLEMPNLGTDVKDAFEIILILADLKQNIYKNKFYQKAISICSRQSEPLIKDYCNSALIRSDLLNKNFDDAKKRYIDLDTPGTITQECFFELICGLEELQNYYNSKKHSCDEILLNALYRGSIRLNKTILTNTIAEYIDRKYNSENSILFKFIAKANEIYKQIGNSHYWCITLNQKQSIDKLLEEFNEITKNYHGNDQRVIELACNFYSLTIGDNQDLINFCWRNLNEIEKFNSKVAGDIKYKKENDYSGLADGFYEIIKAQNDKSYKKNIVDGITSLSLINEENSLILSHLGSPREILMWLESGAKFDKPDTLSSSFSLLEFEIIACLDNSGSIRKLSSKIDSFLKKFNRELPLINPNRLQIIINKLFNLEISIYVCYFIKPLLPSKDIWPSPLVLDYINALFTNEQDKTLGLILKNIHEDEWPSFLWSIKAKYSFDKDELNEAIISIEKALEISPKSLNYWNNYLFLKKILDPSDIEAIKEVPVEVIGDISINGIELLNEFVFAKRFKDIEKVILNWFISDPINSSKLISNFLINVLVIDKTDCAFSDSVGHCIKAIVINKSSETLLKLILDEVPVPNEYFVLASSNLGKKLIATEVKESFQLGMDTYEILDNITPIQAINIISRDLRLKNNDGTDCFYSFKTPENLDELPAFIESKLQLNKGSKEDWLSNPYIPYLMKGKSDNPFDLVDNVLQNLITSDVPKSPLPFTGVLDPTKIILDIHSSIYLCLAGFVKSLIELYPDTFMTIETKHSMQIWYNKKIEEEGLSIGLNPDRKLFISDAKQINVSLRQILENLDLLISHSKIIEFKANDLPLSIIKHKEAFDRSVFSTLKTVISRDISWLCIDSGFINLINQLEFQDTELQIINAHKFLPIIGKSVKIDDKINILILHGQSNLPYTLTFDEIFELSESKNIHANDALLAVLKQPIRPEIKLKDLIPYFSTILVNLIKKEPIGEEISTNKNTDTIRNIFLIIYNHLSIRETDEPIELILAVQHFRILSTFYENTKVQDFVTKIIENQICIKGWNIDLFNDYINQFKSKA